MLAAQGYQESQLDQNAKSQVGAIGVMQIMPATGKEMNVGDIRQVEANIHAGIKYMRWMIDNYYGKEPMTKLDKALFAFASYNAGPGRIAQLRKEAAKRGLKAMGVFRGFAVAGCEPNEMGIGPVLAVPKLLHRFGLKVNDIDLWELNEAFAAQVLACLRGFASDDYCRRQVVPPGPSSSTMPCAARSFAWLKSSSTWYSSHTSSPSAGSGTISHGREWRVQATQPSW